LIGLVLAAKIKETQHHIHPKHETETEITALANRTINPLIWYAFYDLRPGSGVGPIFTTLEPTCSATSVNQFKNRADKYWQKYGCCAQFVSLRSLHNVPFNLARVKIRVHLE